AASGKTVTVTANLAYSLSGPPALWAPDSSFFVYSKSDKLYYYSIDQLKQNRVVDETYRTIGGGTVANVKWGTDGYLYYVYGSLVYRIASSELFTRSLYSDLLNIGTIAGKIPFNFDSNFDNFWISPDGGSILLDKEGRNLFLYLLRTDDYQSAGQTKSLPYLLLPRNTRVKDVLWSQDGTITLLTRSILGHSDGSTIFRLNIYDPSGTPLFHQTEEGDLRSVVLSPDGTKAVILKTDSVVVRDYRTWKELGTYSEPDPLHALWLSSGRLIVAGGWFTDEINLSDGSRDLISLSQPGSYGFEKGTAKVLTESKGRILALVGSAEANSQGDPAAGNAAKASGAGADPAPAGADASITAPGVDWTTAESYSVGEPVVASNQYRVYTDSAQSMSYANIVMVRRVQGEGTQPLFPFPQIRYQAFPSKDQPVDFSDFTHGSRIRRREVALVFNAVDTVDGLTTVLNTLKEYNLRATFFVNGEFMRRNPGAVREISDAGQEVGSLFFTYFNMTDSRFKPDATFIKQGLGRTEDDYYSLTGKELSLLWHTPYYFTNSEIITAGEQMNYTYVGRDVDPLDWVTKSDALQGANIYLSSANIINRIMKLKEPGSIIPIRIGKTSGQRDDYIWNKLDVLINDLISLGYSIVPVSTLMEHAR
ncbi:MAG TPA: polysaccharide deacetylase family protein, partial [Spirochaetia bacterium]|nr:polysaccharide deacetylase family protein [Spirochaetia bacterium]